MGCIGKARGVSGCFRVNWFAWDFLISTLKFQTATWSCAKTIYNIIGRTFTAGCMQSQAKSFRDPKIANSMEPVRWFLASSCSHGLWDTHKRIEEPGTQTSQLYIWRTKLSSPFNFFNFLLLLNHAKSAPLNMWPGNGTKSFCEKLAYQCGSVWGLAHFLMHEFTTWLTYKSIHQ